MAEREPRRKATKTAWFACGALTLVVLYPLSLGPVLVVWKETDILTFKTYHWEPRSRLDETVNAFYAPLMWAAESKIVARPLHGYLSWFDTSKAYQSAHVCHLLDRARKEMRAGDLDAARRLGETADFVSSSHGVEFRLLEDRPELVLADVSRRERTRTPTNQTGVVGN